MVWTDQGRSVGVRRQRLSVGGDRPVEQFFTKEEAVARAAELNAESPLITGGQIRKEEPVAPVLHNQSANTPKPVATDPAFDEHGHYTGEWF